MRAVGRELQPRGYQPTPRHAGRVHDWLDFWSSLGLIVAGMTHQDCDLQLTADAARYRRWRMLVYKAGEYVRLVSRNGRLPHPPLPRHRGWDPKLSARTLVLDGEMAIYDQQLR